MTGDIHGEPSHLLVLCGAALPEDLQERSAGVATEQVDLLTAEGATLADRADKTVERLTVVAPGWGHLRLAVLPARLLGSARDVVIRLTDDTPRSLRSTGVGPLAMKGATVEVAGTDADHFTARIRRDKPMKLVEVLRGLLGPELATLPAPPRIAITSRLLEPFAIGNPFVRYAGVDDEVTSVHLSLSTVDLVLEDGGAAAGAMVPSASAGSLPRVRVLSEAATDGALEALPPVDTVVVNPIGFDSAPKRRSGRIVAGDERGRVLRVVDDTGTELFSVGPGEPLTRRQVQSMRRCHFVAVDAPADDYCLARLLAQLAVSGAPVVAPDLTPAVAGLLGEEVAAEITGTAAGMLEDPLRREVVSVRLRRAALRHHSPAAVGARIAAAAGLPSAQAPSVSVVLVTRRPGFLSSALAQIDRQTWPDVEVVVGLHGDHFDDTEVRRAVDAVNRPVTVLAMPGTRTFGDALNAACAAATGTYISKWDDDDLYGAHHLEDLVTAAGYSGAALIGKGSNFTVLDDQGVTVVGPNPSSERRVRNVAGGTFLLRRSTLEDVGGWRPLPYSVDRALLNQVLDAGGQIYRTHQMGYLLRRHGQGHTWDPGLDYFLDNATEQWPVTSARQDMVLETVLDG